MRRRELDYSTSRQGGSVSLAFVVAAFESNMPVLLVEHCDDPREDLAGFWSRALAAGRTRQYGDYRDDDVEVWSEWPECSNCGRPALPTCVVCDRSTAVRTYRFLRELRACNAGSSQK